MTQIIAFAGKKQSGKNTCCNFITALKLIENGVCKSSRINEDGEIEVTDIFGESGNKKWMLFKKPYVNAPQVLKDLNKVRIYGFADALKDLVIDIFNLPREKVYGSDADKMTETYLRWENMPGVVTNKKLFDSITKKCLGPNMPKSHQDENFLLVYHEPGPMAIRDILQFVGTEIFRKMYQPVWLEVLFRRIKEDNPELALIYDARFDNELISVDRAGGIVVGLKKDIFKSKDLHKSEEINFNLCHKVVENGSMTFDEQFRAVYEALVELGCKNLTVVPE